MSQTAKVSSSQLDLFSTVLHSYSAKNSGVMSNQSLYEEVASMQGLSDEELNSKIPIGKDGALHNPFKRKIRWQQQTLRAAGILEHVDGQQGIWQLTAPASKDLNKISGTVSVIGFSTDLGIAILGCCETVFASIDAPISLVVTSPPFPLAVPRNYGNVPEAQYVDWICKTLAPVIKNLAPGGSICINLSNDIFLSGSPARSIYRERLVIALIDRFGLWKMDELIWENKSKPPGPIRYASIDRTQLNVVYEPIYWFTNDPSCVNSNNRRVLQAHSERHLKLIKQGGERRQALSADGAYGVKHGSYGNQTEGRIPRNILSFGHRCPAQTAYKLAAKAMGLPVHGAPMPLKLASFLIEFMSEPGQLVVDPFAGSFTTLDAAQRLGRRWIGTECMVEYVMGAASRFVAADGFNNRLAA